MMKKLAKVSLLLIMSGIRGEATEYQLFRIEVGNPVQDYRITKIGSDVAYQSNDRTVFLHPSIPEEPVFYCLNYPTMIIGQPESATVQIGSGSTSILVPINLGRTTLQSVGVPYFGPPGPVRKVLHVGLVGTPEWLQIISIFCSADGTDFPKPYYPWPTCWPSPAETEPPEPDASQAVAVSDSPSAHLPAQKPPKSSAGGGKVLRGAPDPRPSQPKVSSLESRGKPPLSARLPKSGKTTGVSLPRRKPFKS
ncbi:MAG: hypothetical protein LBJ92_00250 [Holosporales bacterium]|jgi:hypothetical protein|nr:hypothetical protein [Holosporales bacterium]